MKKYSLFIIIVLLLASCAKAVQPVQQNRNASFSKIEIDTLLKDSISIRAIMIDDHRVWYAGNKGKYGYVGLDGDNAFSSRITIGTVLPEFRSIAKTAKNIFIASIGNPGIVYSISKDGHTVKPIYREENEKVFYDSMQFWNDKEGIAMGDPTENCLSVIISRDGGTTWEKKKCSDLPALTNGEAAFAASNTNLIVKGKHTWMVSGGINSRVFYSADKGKSWKVYATPIVKGKSMTGIFTADFYDKDNGIIAGGDYELPESNEANKAITSDGGKTWKLIADKQAFGYTSCIQYVPDSNARQIVSIGASGLQYSSDSGQTWKQLLKDKDLYTIRFINTTTAVAAGRNRIIKIEFKI